MRCSICDALHREHTLMCEVEARAAIQQRYDMILPPREETADQNREEMVLLSIKRQAKIASRLEIHKARAHSA